MLVQIQMNIEAALIDRFSIEQQTGTSTLIVQTALVAGETGILRSETCHLVFGTDTQLAVEIHAVALFIDIALESCRPMIAHGLTTSSKTYGQFIHNTSHSGVDVTIFMVCAE